MQLKKNIIAISILITLAVGNINVIAIPKSPAEIKISTAQSRIQTSSRDYQAFNSLAMAYAARAREIHDHSYYTKAEQALESSLNLKPGNLEAQKIKEID